MNIESIKDKKLYIAISKNKHCCDCGNKFHYSMMQYDHVPGRGEKKFELRSGGKNGTEGRNLEEIKEEIKKCDLVCANCHFLRTFKRSEKFNMMNVETDEDLFNMSNLEIIVTYKSNKKFNDKRYYNKIKTMGNIEVNLGRKI